MTLPPTLAAWLADALLALHAAVVVFVVVVPLLVVLGWRRGWWVARSLAVRWAHVLAIGVVVAQAWLGRLCPLTVWEMALRAQAGQATYGESFIAHWLGRLMYWPVPLWVFALVYTAFALGVLATWWRWPPGAKG
ncbi:MAG: DUF2784 domain-containing protein [Pseudomonadota bacterium]|nr:DUF2784 domain-containing protein [Pseudomonadota bacterium]